MKPKILWHSWIETILIWSAIYIPEALAIHKQIICGYRNHPGMALTPFPCCKTDTHEMLTSKSTFFQRNFSTFGWVNIFTPKFSSLGVLEDHKSILLYPFIPLLQWFRGPQVVPINTLGVRGICFWLFWGPWRLNCSRWFNVKPCETGKFLLRSYRNDYIND